MNEVFAAGDWGLSLSAGSDKKILLNPVNPVQYIFFEIRIHSYKSLECIKSNSTVMCPGNLYSETPTTKRHSKF